MFDEDRFRIHPCISSPVEIDDDLETDEGSPGIVSIERIAGNGTGRPREGTMSPVNSSSAIPGNAHHDCAGSLGRLCVALRSPTIVNSPTKRFVISQIIFSLFSSNDPLNIETRVVYPSSADAVGTIGGFVEKRGSICCKKRVVFGGTECFFSSCFLMIQEVELIPLLCLFHSSLLVNINISLHAPVHFVS
jgi:hypothetical protein